jgi:hypothetical protein
MRMLLSLAALAFCAGCASQAPAPVAVAQATTTSAPTVVASKQVCRKETVVGSNFPQTVCHGGPVDPNDVDVQRNVDDLDRALGTQQSTMMRAGVGK